MRLFDEIYEVRVNEIVRRYNKSIIFHALCRGRPVEEIAEYISWSIDDVQEIANNFTDIIYESVCENMISVARGAKLLRITEEELRERMDNAKSTQQDL